MHISFVIPTRNRQQELAYTLRQLEELSLDELGGQSEVIIIDNDSDALIELPDKLSNGIEILMVALNENLGAGARNIGVEHARGDWVIMLDDDSSLFPGATGEYLSNLDTSVAAVGGEIFLPNGQHESGGLPEVIVGCGCAIRRRLFLDVGGYDAGFGYYAEEYDLCAKLIAAGHSVTHSRAIHFEHRKCSVGRNMNEILYRLVRNNGWVIQRYAPDGFREDAIREVYTRYRQIAINEDAIEGYQRGIDELERTINDQQVLSLSTDYWDRFIGTTALRSALSLQLDSQRSKLVSIVGPARGKGLGQIRSEIQAMGFEIDQDNPARGQRVIGTLSPGPMLDAKQMYPDAVCPWLIEDSATLSVQQ